MPRRTAPISALSGVAFAVLLAACADEPMPREVPVFTLATKADSVAMQAYEGMGGPEAWASAPFLRFDFGFERNERRTVARRHLWNRATDDYRMEWTDGDSSYVALFNVATQEGDVFLNGAPLDSVASAEMLRNAYRGFINDTYWLLAPSKMLDAGVTRTYMADSSDADTDVLMLTFDGVGLTPGDRYWMYVDRETGRTERWRFLLESGGQGDFAWTGYETFETPRGSVHVATRKENPVGGALLTDAVAFPSDVPDAMFTDPAPRLAAE